MKRWIFAAALLAALALLCGCGQKDTQAKSDSIPGVKDVDYKKVDEQ